MQIESDTIDKFLTERKQQFIVPVYQRNYSWEKEQCEKLFQDLFEIVESEEEHFIGTFFVKDENHKSIVIDGQQRITSIFLLMKALYDHATNKDIKEDIEEYLYSNKHDQTLRLQLNKKDNYYFHLIIEMTDYEFLSHKIDTLSEEEKQSHIILNYQYFYQYIDNYMHKGYEISQLFSCFEKVSICVLRLGDENPQEIYESLNSTGLPLTTVDRLRNRFLMNIPYDKQIECYEKYWLKIEEYVGAANMESFFIDFLVCKRHSDYITLITGRGSHLGSSNLYSQFELYYQSVPGNNPIEKIENLLADLTHYAFIYKDFCFPADFTYNCNDYSSLQQRLYPLLVIGNKKANGVRSLLLYIRNLVLEDRINEDTFDHVINILESFVFRSLLCSYTSTKYGLNRQFAGNIMLELSKKADYSRFIDSFIKKVTAGKNSYSFPTDEEIKFSLLHSDSYNHSRSKTTKYVLYRLELASPYSKGITPYNEQTLQIEHVLPQKLDDEWKKKLPNSTKNNHDKYCNLLGNLVLTNNNQALSNNYFDTKKQTYAHETFYNTQQISQYTQWTEDEIIQRTNQLAEGICQIWKVPTSSDDWLTINDALASDITGKKPKDLIFKNSKYQVKTWKDMSVNLFEFLYDENSNTINQFAAENPKLIHTTAGGTNDYPLGNTGFFTLGKSAPDTLRLIQRLLSFYDNKAGTDYESTMKFTIQ